MNRELDNDLGKVLNQKWLPFIGDNYLDSPFDKKVLIVGESHYHDATEESIAKHENSDFTREIVEELAIQRHYWNTKIFPNFHRALFGNDEFSTEVFWNLVSFYNFVQRPMDTNKGRPTYDDFYAGWATFFETIKIVKPKTCLFIGTEASNSIEHALEKCDFEIVKFVKDDKISRTYPRRVIIKNKDNQEIELLFIQHTSQYFSWGKWHNYLKGQLVNQLNWFEQKMN